jgi:hypothetical protein
MKDDSCTADDTLVTPARLANQATVVQRFNTWQVSERDFIDIAMCFLDCGHASGSPP